MPRSDLLKGTLNMLILRSLELEARHAMAIAERIERVTAGYLPGAPGSLFPALQRLERGGFVQGEWSSSGGRRFCMYALTASGRCISTASSLSGRVSSWQSPRFLATSPDELVGLRSCIETMATEDERCAEAKKFRQIDDAFHDGHLDALRVAVDDLALVPNGQMPVGIGSCLVNAVYHSPLTFIRTLLEIGADPNAPVNDGFPPFIGCAQLQPRGARRDEADRTSSLTAARIPICAHGSTRMKRRSRWPNRPDSPTLRRSSRAKGSLFAGVCDRA